MTTDGAYPETPKIPENTLTEAVKGFFFDLPESVSAMTNMPSELINLKDDKLRGEMYELFFKLAVEHDVQEAYVSLTPVMYPFHNFWHACRVYMYSFFMGKALELSDEMMEQLGKDALRHDLGMARLGNSYKSHEEVFGEYSLVPTTKLVLKGGSTGALVQTTRFEEFSSDGGCIADLLTAYENQGIDRSEVEKAVGILGDADLLGLGNGKGMAAALLEAYKVKKEQKDATTKIDNSLSEDDQKLAIVKMFRDTIKIYSGVKQYGFNTDLANQIMTKEIIQQYIDQLSSCVQSIDEWFPSFVSHRDQFLALDETADYAEVFGIIDKLSVVIELA